MDKPKPSFTMDDFWRKSGLDQVKRIEIYDGPGAYTAADIYTTRDGLTRNNVYDRMRARCGEGGDFAEVTVRRKGGNRVAWVLRPVYEAWVERGENIWDGAEQILDDP